MKQYGYSRCMGKEEEKWYPEEREEKCFDKEERRRDRKEKCRDKEDDYFDKEDDCFEEEKRRDRKEKCFDKEERRRDRKEKCRDKEDDYFDKEDDYFDKDCERKERCKVVVEPTVHCKEEKSFRHCVKHIVPVVCKEIENHHFDHEYVIEKKVIKEKNRFDHGRRNEDWCKLAGCRRRDKDDCDCE